MFQWSARRGREICGSKSASLFANCRSTRAARCWPSGCPYLNKDERAQWQAGLTTFLNSLIKDDPQPDRGTNRSMARVKNLLCLTMVAGLLTGCARGRGIGLEAMVADYNCEQAGYRLGTPIMHNAEWRSTSSRPSTLPRCRLTISGSRTTTCSISIAGRLAPTTA